MKKLFEYLRDFQLNEPVYIVGTGPNAIGKLSLIPDGVSAIALNGMVASLQSEFWFCADKRAIEQPWWPPTPPYPIRIIGDQLDKIAPGNADYVFTTVPGFRDKSVHGFVNGVLRGNVTIAGLALQFCHFTKVKKVIFVGLDFCGRGHYDGHVNEGSLFINSKTGIWKHRGIFQELINLCESHGMKITTLTQTALEVKCET